MSSQRAPSPSRRRATSLTSSHVAGRVYSVMARPLDDGLDRPAEAIGVHLGVARVKKDALGRAGHVASHRGERLPGACRRWLAQRRRAPLADDQEELLARQRIADHGQERSTRNAIPSWAWRPSGREAVHEARGDDREDEEVRDERDPLVRRGRPLRDVHGARDPEVEPTREGRAHAPRGDEPRDRGGEPKADVREAELAHDDLGVRARQVEDLARRERRLDDLAHAPREKAGADSPEDEPTKRELPRAPRGRKLDEDRDQRQDAHQRYDRRQVPRAYFFGW